MMDTVPTPGPPGAARPVTPVIAPQSLGRRRRPSGEPPPLPRHIDYRTRWYLLLLALTVTFWAVLSLRPVLGFITRADLTVLHGVAAVRSAPLTRLMLAGNELTAVWVVRVIAWGTIATLLAFRRFRHLAVYLVIYLAVATAAAAASGQLGRMRPAGITILGPWQGYAEPSRPVAALALVLAGAVYTLLPEGRWRSWGKAVAAVVLGVVCLARLYLAVDAPTDLLAALVLGWVLTMVVFRLAVPGEAFPVSYRGGQRAHLDVGGRRGAAIVSALDHQLGLDVASVTPFGLAASAGSTPLQLRVRGRGQAGEPVLFGKLYALSHLRSDRWYKLARTVIYGRLEDEKPFSTVRRLVEYEDHLLRLMRDAGLPTPAPYGFAEITPEREYVIVMEFFSGAREMRGIPVDDQMIDDALRVVRRMWDAGLAHRDIKPSNVLVRDSRVLLIDVAFATVRPTPWRQAVDLANMMLTLALGSTAGHVYQRALGIFAAEDVAEAFAASRSITVPTQLRALIRADGRDLAGEFRRLAPKRRPIPIQLWDVPRARLTAVLAAGVAAAVAVLVAYVRIAGLL